VTENSSAAPVSSSVAGRRSTIASAEIALNGAAEPGDVLHRQRLVESE